MEPLLLVSSPERLAPISEFVLVSPSVWRVLQTLYSVERSGAGTGAGSEPIVLDLVCIFTAPIIRFENIFPD